MNERIPGLDRWLTTDPRDRDEPEEDDEPDTLDLPEDGFDHEFGAESNDEDDRL